MDEFTRCRLDCQMGIKAYQNIRASVSSFERLCSAVDSDDHLLISSYFHKAVISYSKPFIGGATTDGLARYPIKHLKKTADFSGSMHEHLLEVRNTLIAHDDFVQIEPKILSFGFSLEGADFQIPTTIITSNKTISHPADLDGALKMQKHVKAALIGIQNKFGEDITRLRKIGLEKPEQKQKAEQYSKHYGKSKISESGSQLTPPDFSKDSYLNTREPDFSDVHNGYRYEEIRIRIDFNGPERIKLPNGYEVEISPNPTVK